MFSSPVATFPHEVMQDLFCILLILFKLSVACLIVELSLHVKKDQELKTTQSNELLIEALTEIQNLLKDTADQALAVRESLIVAASNRFFTLIPSIHPHIIRDEDDLMIKVCAHYLVVFL